MRRFGKTPIGGARRDLLAGFYALIIYGWLWRVAKLEEREMRERVGEAVSGCLHFETVLRIFKCCLWYGRRVR